LSLWRWFLALGQRLLLAALAAVILTMLLHLPTGLRTGQSGLAVDLGKISQATQSYVRNVARGDWGALEPLGVPGYREPQPMAAILRIQAPRSALLLLFALALCLLLGTLAGLLTSRFGLRRLRSVALSGTLLLLSTPDILLVLFLRRVIVFVLSEFGVKILSLSSLGTEVTPSHYIGPVVALAALPLVVVARTVTVAFDEVYEQLYIRTAVAKGLSPWRVTVGHAMKNAWIRVAEAGPVIMSSLVTGLVVVEYVLYFPGLGRTLGLLLERANSTGRFPIVPAAPASSIALVLMAGAFLVDLLFAFLRLGLDPRIAQQQGAQGAAGSLRVRLADLHGGAGAMAGWLRELPEQIRNVAWRWRPRHVAREILTNPPLLLGLTGIGVILFFAVYGDQIVDLQTGLYKPTYITVDGEVFFPPFKPGTHGYPLGSDLMGRSLLARLLSGTRYTLLFTLAVTPVRLAIALPWGMLAGLRGRLWAGASRTLGMVFSAVPVLLIPAALLPIRDVARLDTSTGIGFLAVVAIVAVAGIPRLVEVIRQHVEAIALQPFIEGARAAGAGTGRILLRHILPHLAPQLWVAAAIDMAWTLLLLTQFGVFSMFPGGAQVLREVDDRGVWHTTMLPRLPDWASMLSRPYDVVYKAPWSLWYPAFAFFFAIIAFNLVAEGLRRRATMVRAVPVPDRHEVTPRHRAALALEWGIVVALALSMAGAGQLAASRMALAVQATAPTTLEAQIAKLSGWDLVSQETGQGPERSFALTRMAQETVKYLKESSKAGQKLAQVQIDSQGRFTILEQAGFRMVNIYVDSAPDGLGSYVFLQNLFTGEVTYTVTAERPTSFAVIPPTDHEPGYLILAGTIPKEDAWVVSFHRGWITREQQTWDPPGDEVERALAQLPASLQVKLIRQKEHARLQQTRGPMASTRVEPNGDLTFCEDRNQGCVTVPFRHFGR